MAEEDRRNRARDWSVRIRPLAEPEPDDLADSTTAEERLALVWTLSKRMWELTGRPFPAYERSQIPVRVFRGQ